MPLSFTWPADGTKNWGAQVDANLDAIVAQVNANTNALATVTTASQGATGPAGPIPMRFYNGSGWDPRPTGTDATPIISVSTPYPGAPVPPNAIEGDVWYPAGSLGSATSGSTGQTVDYVRADDPQFGLPATGDCTNALASAMSYANTARKHLILPNRYMLISAPLTWSIAKGSLISGGDLCAIDARFMTSGPALYLTGLASHEGIYNEVTGFHLMGPESSATTIDGIYLGDDSYGADNGTLSHMTISGFRDQVVCGNNTWLTTFYKTSFTLFQRRAFYLNHDTTTNTGENFTFRECVISGGAAGATAGIHQVGGGINMYGCSYDYNNCPPILIESGGLHIFGAHFEDSNPEPFVTINQGNTNSSAALLDLHSAHFQPYDSVKTRAMVENLSTSHGNVAVNFFGGDLSKTSTDTYTIFKDSSTAGVVASKYGTRILTDSSTITTA